MANKFKVQDGITYPDGTTQSTAYEWVDPPASSTGASGDKEGMVAYDGNYHYYCKANFGSAPTETFTVSNVGEGSNVISVNKTNNPNYTIPQPGWYTVIGGVTMTLTAFSANNANGVDWNFLFDVASGAVLPSTVTLTSNTGYTDIWVRVAWTGTSW